MKIVAHRGFWKDTNQKNSKEAFHMAFDSGFGVETDIRDDRGNLVICHDLPSGSEMLLSEFFELLNGRNLLLALNIKSDGLTNKLKDLLSKYNIENYFTFDMSFPESRRYVSKELCPYLSISEFQRDFFRLHEYAGVWLDAFESEWYSQAHLEKILSSLTKKKVCIVSPELHGRDHLLVWEKLRAIEANLKIELAICTDFPDKAEIFFNRKQ
jgi:hypothetical protein